MGFTRLLTRFALGRRLPITSGDLRVRGPRAPVTIRRDRYGVPHIDAESPHDADFALGFCQGQDRAAQLEVLWRIGRGRLAEWVGARGLDADRMSRRIGFRRAAEKQLLALADGPRGRLAAFAAGVCAGTTTGLPKKPHEFAIVGGEPSAWDAADVLAMLKLQSFALPSNWDVELARLRILLADGRRRSSRSIPSAGRGKPILPPCRFCHARRAHRRPRGARPSCRAAAARTMGHRRAHRDRKPILCNDRTSRPRSRHRGTRASGARSGRPEARRWPAPSFPIGHNGFAAWGVTAG